MRQRWHGSYYGRTRGFASFEPEPKPKPKPEPESEPKPKSEPLGVVS